MSSVPSLHHSGVAASRIGVRCSSHPVEFLIVPSRRRRRCGSNRSRRTPSPVRTNWCRWPTRHRAGLRTRRLSETASTRISSRPRQVARRAALAIHDTISDLLKGDRLGRLEQLRVQHPEAPRLEVVARFPPGMNAESLQELHHAFFIEPLSFPLAAVASRILFGQPLPSLGRNPKKRRSTYNRNLFFE